MPNLYKIAGCNGAGKTTASYTILPKILNCKEFLNADEIARGLSPFQPEKVAITAGRIMLQRIDELIKLKIDFAIETTLTTKSYAHTIEIAKQNGYDVTLLYFWLSNVQLAIERVKKRAEEGGHNIPEETIRRGYRKGMYNLINTFIGCSTYWFAVDNSGKIYTFIAGGLDDTEITIHDNGKWEKIKENAI